MTIFLAVTGTQGSGKTVFTEIAKEKYKIPTFRLGDIIVKECKKRGIEVNGKNMGKLAVVLRYEKGPQAIAMDSLPFIQKFIKDNPKLVIIDGIRSDAELACFKREFSDVRLVAVISSYKIRKKRVEARKRVDLGSDGDFEEREYRELRFGLGEIITKADYYILNDELTKKEFISKIEGLLEKILAE